MEVSLAQLSPAQLRKMHMGHPVRAKLGHHHRVMVSHEHAKKLMSAHKKGASATIGGRLLTDLKGDVSTVAQAGTDYAVGKIGQHTPDSGSGVRRRRRHRHHEMHEHGEGLMHGVSHNAHMVAHKANHAIGGSSPQPITFYDQNHRKLHAHVVPLKPLPASHSGGKVNRLNKFNRWFKSIGQKVKTLNHNLKPIKHAASARAADYITMYNNPQAQAQSLLDTTQSEASQFRHLAGRRHKAPTSMQYAHAPTSMVQYVPAPTQYSVPPVEAYPVDVNGDGEPEGFFYPNEKQWFGGKVHKKRGKGIGRYTPTNLPPRGDGVQGSNGHSLVRAYRGSGFQGEYGRSLAQGTHSGGRVKRAPSAWVQHVKAYAHHHGIKYGDALKQARASYKSGGALYPAGYDPNRY